MPYISLRPITPNIICRKELILNLREIIAN